MNFGQIRLLILDVDGVLTDGAKTYDTYGNIVSKRFNDKDFTAIKRFVQAGVPVVWLSGDDCVNEAIAFKRNIPFYHSKHSGRLSKKEFVEKFQEEYKCKAEEMCYVGDDWFDLDIMEKVGFPICPSDAITDIKARFQPISCKAGEGVVAHLFDIYCSWTNHQTNDEALRDIDSKDK